MSPGFQAGQQTKEKIFTFVFMKTILLALLLFSAACTAAQKTQYYNWNWKPCDAADARFVSITDKTDSGWVRRDFYLSTKKSQMKGLYSDSTLKTKNG